MRVEILLPGPNADKRFVQLAGESSYAQLLESGVRIWHFQPSMLHAKIMTIDGVVANIGSANLNSRSTELDEEINLVAFDPDLVRVLDAQFDDDLERSEEIVAGRWEHRSVPQRVLERRQGSSERDVRHETASSARPPAQVARKLLDSQETAGSNSAGETGPRTQMDPD